MTSLMENCNEEQMVVTFDPPTLKKLIDKINQLNDPEQYQIFNIICENKQKFTENQNGIFINFNQLNQVTLQQIYQFVIFFEQQKQNFEKHNKLLEQMETFINNKINSSTDVSAMSSSMCVGGGDMESGSVGEMLDDCKSDNSDNQEYMDDNEDNEQFFEQEMDDTEKTISGILQKNNRKRDLTLNKTKPRYNGSSARIAKKCNYLETPN